MAPAAISIKSWIFDRFGEGLGRLWGGFWEVFGRGLEGSGGFGMVWGGSGDVLGAFWEVLEGIGAQIISWVSPGGF